MVLGRCRSTPNRQHRQHRQYTRPIHLPSERFLLDMYIARSRMHPKQWAAATHLSMDRFMCISDASLHGHLDRCSNINRSGTGRNVGIEGGVRRQLQTHIAGSGARVPRSTLLPFGSDFTAPGFSMEAALHATRGNVSRTRVQVIISRTGFLDLDVAAARSATHGAGHLLRPYVSRASLQPQLALEIRQANVARASGNLSVSARPFNSLVAGAAFGTDDGLCRHRDVVINRNVAIIHVVNPDVVSILPNRRILLDGVNVVLALP